MDGWLIVTASEYREASERMFFWNEDLARLYEVFAEDLLSLALGEDDNEA